MQSLSPEFCRTGTKTFLHSFVICGFILFLDVIYEDTGSPENSSDLRKENQDCLFPLMGKGRFKMKPKGLLER